MTLIENRNEQMQHLIDFRYDEVQEDKKIAQARYTEMQDRFEANNLDKAALNTRCDNLLKLTTENENKLSERMSVEYKQLNDFVTSVDKVMQESVRRMDRTISVTRQELFETLNDRQERMKH